MIRLLIRVAAMAGVLLLLPHVILGITLAGPLSALVAAVCWGLMSVTVRPLLALLTLPINLLTLGLFWFVLNALLFWLLAALLPGFAVAGFVPALEGSVVLLLVSWLLHAVLAPRD